VALVEVLTAEEGEACVFVVALTTDEKPVYGNRTKPYQ
jgi:hypothetical protein